MKTDAQKLDPPTEEPEPFDEDAEWQKRGEEIDRAYEQQQQRELFPEWYE